VFWSPLPRFRYVVPVHTVPAGTRKLQQAWQNMRTAEAAWRDVPTEVVSAYEFNGTVRLSARATDSREGT
jgi:hypothetical protein